MKNLANYISISRIILSIFLLFTVPLSIPFFIMFVLCCISDVLDGFIARKFGFNSDLGAKLDSLGDIVFFLVYLTIILQIFDFNYFMIMGIIGIFLIKMISLAIGFRKFGKLSFIHTYLNKFTGLCLVLLPFSLIVCSSEFVLIVMLLIATIACIEELMIIVFSNSLDLDCNSIFNLL